MKTDGGPAFPTMDSREGDMAPSLASPGMSLLDYFAAAALAGIYACPETFCQRLTPAEGAEGAYNVAEAMIAERAKRRK